MLRVESMGLGEAERVTCDRWMNVCVVSKCENGPMQILSGNACNASPARPHVSIERRILTACQISLVADCWDAAIYTQRMTSRSEGCPRVCSCVFVDGMRWPYMCSCINWGGGCIDGKWLSEKHVRMYALVVEALTFTTELLIAS